MRLDKPLRRVKMRGSTKETIMGSGKVKDASGPDYFDPAWAFLEKVGDEIAEHFEFGSFTIWPGYFENPVDADDSYHLNIEISPKALEVYGGSEDGAGIFSPLSCEDVLAFGESFLVPENDETDHLTVTYKSGKLSIWGRYREDPKRWGLTLVLNPTPQKEDEAGANDQVNHKGFGLPY
jgi:hypothetical protein